MSPQDVLLKLDGTWLFQVDSLDRGLREGWYARGHQRSGWREVAVPEYWDRYNLSSYDGVGWFAKTFDHVAHDGRLALFFGGVDDDADVWVNGTKVGSHAGYSEAFFFDVTHAVRSGENEVVVRVNDHGGPGGIYRPVVLVSLGRVRELLRTPYAERSARPSAGWVKDAVIYEVYLRSFSPEGTFRALERRLAELRDLGVTVLWLMPIHPIGKVNRKGTLGSPYAVQDYYAINPEFGTLDDFKALVRTVHNHGMKIILDLVANHTAWDHDLLRTHPEWYSRDDHGTIVAPNDDWTDVADLNYDVPEVWDYMIEMMKYWVRDVGIDGFRCDVAELVPTEFWERARRELDALKEVMMLSEGTLPEHHMKAFDLTYAWNFHDVLAKAITDSTPAERFTLLLENEALQFPKGSLRLRFHTNHDKNAWDAPSVKKYSPAGAKAAAVLTFTFPGVPLVYNGEEVGNEKRLHLFEKFEIDWSKNPDFLQLYRTLGNTRKQFSSLQRGEFIPLSNSENTKVISFLRADAHDTVLVVVNLSNTSRTVTVQVGERAGTRFRDLFTLTEVEKTEGNVLVPLRGYGYAVFVPY